MTQPYEPLSFDERPSQPVYKRPWFVVVGGLATIGVLGAVIGGSSAEDPAEVAAAPTSTSASRAPAAPSPPVPATPSSPVPAAPPTTEAPVPTAAPPTGVDFVMPDVVGMD